MNCKAIIAGLLVVVCICQGRAFAEEPESLTNAAGMKMIRIEAGSFTMGMDGKELGEGLALRDYLKNGDFDESPRHKVTISKAFYISETEVTVEQYKKFRSSWPGFRATWRKRLQPRRPGWRPSSTLNESRP